MTQMTRQLANAIRVDAEAALQSVAEKHGCHVKTVGGNFSGSSLVQKVEFVIIGEDGKVQTREMEDMRTNLMFTLRYDRG